ncbi:MAG: phenylalanine--tRNA ligase subunit alpha [Hyphomicrobium sp.]
MGNTSDLALLENELLKEIKDAKNLEELESVRVSSLGKKGKISEAMAILGKLPPEERKSYGALINTLKSRVSEALDQCKTTLEALAIAERISSERADITLPVRLGPETQGRIHPVSHVLDECIEIFSNFGFEIAEGPDIETDDLNFTKLNIPADHPARQEHDTFYFHPKPDGTRLLLRTHTSPVQIRSMQTKKPPIRVIAPGRVYRSDSDQTHTPMFHQIEGLVIDETTHMGHLKWLLEEFTKAFFEVSEVKMRFRASHFPFTEPSMEVDIDTATIGKPGQWLEILGCGMVHPKVLNNCQLDPEKYQGFAFGVGLDRLAMLKYGLTDLRAFFSADIQWLRHYGFSIFEQPTLSGGLSS